MSESADKIARTYQESKNPNGESLPGVPLRDITIAEWESFPLWIKASIDGWSAYSIPKGAPERVVYNPQQE